MWCVGMGGKHNMAKKEILTYVNIFQDNGKIFSQNENNKKIKMWKENLRYFYEGLEYYVLKRKFE